MHIGCDRLIEVVESRIEEHKKDFSRSPEFIVVSKEYYECFMWHQSRIQPGSDLFIRQFQGINLVLIPGHEILELAGSPGDMLLRLQHNLKS